MGGKIQFAFTLFELNVALALGDEFFVFLSDSLRKICKDIHFPGKRVIPTELSAYVVTLGREDIIDRSVAGNGDGIIGIMGILKAGIDPFSKHATRGK